MEFLTKINFDYLKIIVTVCLAVFGWLVGNFFSKRRDQNIKRREISTRYLIEAFKILTDVANRTNQNSEDNRKIERVVAEIQLFGTEKQVEMAKACANEIASRNNCDMMNLITDLRNDLRKELKLQEIDGEVSILRFKNS